MKTNWTTENIPSQVGLYYQDLLSAAELAHRLNRPQDQERLSGQARELGAAIQEYCWDPRDRFYYTVDVQCVDRRAELEHFQFWCIQGKRPRRGFSSRKDALR